MTCSSCSSTVEKFGATPANIQWSVVRGDTAKLRIEFFQNNETSEYDTDGWVYEATVYNPTTNLTESLSVLSGEGYVDIIASANLTENWGTGYSNIVAELPFDLQVTIPAEGSGLEDTIWTPVIGTISVIADITPGGL
jgi:hypothetical protein